MREVLKVFYDDERNRLTEVFREDGEVFGKHHKAEHSFFLAAADVTVSVRQMLTSSRYLVSLKREGQWVRACWQSRALCEAAANALFEEDVPVYDAAIPPWLRFVLDNDVKFAVPRACYFDLEWDSRVPFNRKHEATVLCWAVIDAETRESWTGVLQGAAPEIREDETEEEKKDRQREWDDRERQLLEEFFEVLDRFDLIMAWGGDRADFPVLRGRIRRLGIQREFRRWLALDDLKHFKKANMHAAESGEEKQSYALNAIGKSILGEEEGGKTFDASISWDLWAAGGEKRNDLVEGCLHDTDRLYQIEQKTGYLGMFWSVCELTGVHRDSQGANPNVQVESFLLRIAKTKDFRFRMRKPIRLEGTEKEQEEQERIEKFRGAFVMRPTVRGIVKDVHVLDFSRMYPSIILAWNMSPETLVRKPEIPAAPPPYLRHSNAWTEWEAECQRVLKVPEGVVVAPKTNRWFRTDVRGILCLAVEELIKLRRQVSDKKAKCAPGSKEFQDLDRLDQALKIVLNSFYGVIGSEAFRFAERDVAEAVAQAGVWLIDRVIEEAARRIAAKLAYADTDGAYLHEVAREAVEEFTRLCNDQLFPEWLKVQGCYDPKPVKIAYEKAFERIVFPLGADGETGAKRYAGRYSHYKGVPAADDAEPEIKGLEYKRGDSSRLARAMQKEVIDLLMFERCEDPARFREVAARWKKRIVEEPLELEDVVLSQSLSRSLSGYERKPKKYGIKVGPCEVTAETVTTIQVRMAVTGELVRWKKSDIHETSEVPTAKKGVLVKIDWSEGPAHVRIARILAKRGHDVGEGARIAYVVTDGSKSPKEIIPAEDWTGQVDRRDTWESRVWPPTARVLRGAFPGSDWSEFDDAYPKPPKVSKAARKGNPGQGSLF